MSLHYTLIGHGVAVRKNRFVSFFIAVALAMVLLTLPAAAQKKAGKPGAGPLVPADSHFVFSFNIGSLLKKSGHDKIVDLPGIEEAHEEQERDLHSGDLAVLMPTTTLPARSVRRSVRTRLQ